MKRSLIITILFSMCFSGSLAFADDETNAYKLYFADTKKQAEKGDAKAEAALGIAYSSGHGGIPKDDAEAVKWLQKSADQNDPTGETFLGAAYAHGKGVPIDKAKAAKLWARASYQGNLQARTFLGIAYCSGEGVPQDKDTCIKLLRESANAGDGGAADILRLMHVSLKPDAAEQPLITTQHQ